MSNSYEGLLAHVGHDVKIVEYRHPNDPAYFPEDPVNVALKCIDCGEVVLDFDRDEETRVLIDSEELVSVYVAMWKELGDDSEALNEMRELLERVGYEVDFEGVRLKEE